MEPTFPGKLAQVYASYAEIEFVVNEAARSALGQNRPIINGNIRHAAGNNAPAHSAADIEKMR